MGSVGKVLTYTNPLAWPIVAGVLVGMGLYHMGKAVKELDEVM